MQILDPACSGTQGPGWMQRFLSQIQQKSVCGLSGESSHMEPAFPNSDQAFPDLTLADSPEERRLISSFGRKVMRAPGQGANLPGHTLGHRTQHAIGSWLMRFGGRGADIWYAPPGEERGERGPWVSWTQRPGCPCAASDRNHSRFNRHGDVLALGAECSSWPQFWTITHSSTHEQGATAKTWHVLLSVKSQNPQTIAERGETRRVPLCKHAGVLFSWVGSSCTNQDSPKLRARGPQSHM